MTPVILISCAESRDSITTTAVEPLTETVIEMRSWLATPLIATAASVPLPTKRNCTSPLGTPSTAKPPRSSTTDVSEVPVTWTDRPDAWARMSVPALMPITLPVMDAPWPVDGGGAGVDGVVAVGAGAVAALGASGLPLPPPQATVKSAMPRTAVSDEWRAGEANIGVPL